MKVVVYDADLKNVSADTLAVCVWQDGQEAIVKSADKLTGGAIGRFLTKNKKFGKPFESAVFYVTGHKSLEKVVLVGLGKPEKFDTFKLRQVSASIGKQHAKRAKSVAIYFPDDAQADQKSEAVVAGFISGVFDPGQYKTEQMENGKWKLESLEIVTDGDLKKAKNGAEKGLLIGETVNEVRGVVNQPSNIATPQYMVKWAKEIAARNKLKIQVFSEKQVNEMGMGIMASVAKGSEEDLYFVVLAYRHPSAKKTLALVGKGITFDSGGISIKPGEQMDWMKMDMAGAAAVFGAMDVIAKLSPKINVVAACPLTENLPSGRASKPGDVVKGLSGKTAEIINTDAEGRLVLADAITYVEKSVKPDFIVDVATLTGASIVALGNWATAVLGRPQGFIDAVRSAADESGERAWQLPLYDEYREQLKSYIADIANISSIKGGGTQTGAKFIEEFVDEGMNWAHLDIAPNAWEENDKPYAAKGATGVSVSTLVNLSLNLAK